MPTIKARKAQVEADSIVRSITEKHRQTNTHNAQMHIASKNVEVKVVKQYPVHGNNPERPPVGSTIKGRSATISSRKVNHLGPADTPKRTKGVFEDDVTINIKQANGSAKTKPAAKPTTGSAKASGKAPRGKGKR